MKFEVAFADQIVGLEAKVRCYRAVGDNEPALRILHEQIVGHLIDHGPEDYAVGFPSLPGEASFDFCLGTRICRGQSFNPGFGRFGRTAGGLR